MWATARLTLPVIVLSSTMNNTNDNDYSDESTHDDDEQGDGPNWVCTRCTFQNSR